MSTFERISQLNPNPSLFSKAFNNIYFIIATDENDPIQNVLKQVLANGSLLKSWHF